MHYGKAYRWPYLKSKSPMKHSKIKSKFPLIRKQAEEILSEKEAEANVPLTESEILKLVHELEVHQIELELQNKELVAAKESEKILAEKFIAFFDFAPTGYFVLSSDGTIIEINLSGAGLLGKDRLHLKNSNLAFFISYDTRPVLNRFIDNIFQLKTRETCEVKLSNADEDPVYLNITGISLENGQHCLLVAENISEQRRMEKQLIESEASLRKLNATKDKFFSIIAHDLKSPFNSILGFSDILKNQARSFDIREIESYATIINSSAQHTVSLLENLLDWARMQQGQMVFSPKPLNLYNLSLDVIELASETAGQKNIDLIINIPEQMIITADEDMLKTVIRNLISNGIKFCNPGGSVEISANQKNGEAQISVIDKGIGISSENISKLFMIDSGFTTSGTKHEKGTGLGLVLCKDFIGKHGGKIWVESHLEKGSKFLFTLPAKPE